MAAEDIRLVTEAEAEATRLVADARERASALLSAAQKQAADSVAARLAAAKSDSAKKRRVAEDRAFVQRNSVLDNTRRECELYEQNNDRKFRRAVGFVVERIVNA